MDFNGNSTVFLLGKNRDILETVELVKSINYQFENNYQLEIPDFKPNYLLNDEDYISYEDLPSDIIEDEIYNELEHCGISRYSNDLIDGIIMKNVNDSFDAFSSEVSNNYVVFDKNNILSVFNSEPME